MKYLTIFLIIATIFVSCSENNPRENSEKITNDIAKAPTDSLLNRYEISEVKDSIFVIDNSNQKVTNYGYIPDHHSLLGTQYIEQNLYVIRQFYSSKPNELDELWVYNKNKGRPLLKGRKLDFKVNNQQTLIAYNFNNSSNYSYRIDTLSILDLRNNKTRKVRITNDKDIINTSIIKTLKWDANKEIIWGLLASGEYGSNYFFFKYDYTTNTLDRFLVPEGCTIEFDINPNTSQLVYTDCPRLYALEKKKEFLETKKETHVYLYDFTSKKRTLLKTGIATSFTTKWMTDHSIATVKTEGEYEYQTEETLTLKKE